MKSFAKAAAILLAIQGFCLAQDPANFHLIYGNRDGSPIDAALGSVIDVPAWGGSDVRHILLQDKCAKFRRNQDDDVNSVEHLSI